MDNQLGKVVVREVTIQYGDQETDSVNIVNLVNSISIYESIFSKHLTGNVVVVDARNLINNLLLTGQENITINCEMLEGGNPVNRTFRLYKISNLIREGDLVQIYTMHFCDPLMYRSKEERISQALRGSHTDMIEGLFEELSGDPNFIPLFTEFEETQGDNHQFVVPNWSVNKTLDWLVNNSNPIDETSYKNSMFLYQDMKGQYQFKSMDKMLVDIEEEVFHHVPYNAFSEVSAEERNLVILSSNKPQEFDTLRGLSTGAYASLLKIYDPIRKLESVKEYDIEDTIQRRQDVRDGNSILAKESPLTSLITKDTTFPKPHKLEQPTTILHEYTTTHMFDNKDKIDDEEVFMGVKHTDNSKLERHALLEILNQNRIEVVVPFTTKIRAGKKIQLDLPKGQVKIGTNKGIDFDDYYLITGVSIHIDNATKVGTCNLECSKESKLLSKMESNYSEKVAVLLTGMESKKT
jgi:hypothetical protein